MLYYLHQLQDVFSPFRLFQYITVRAVAGAGTAFLLSVLLGPWVIRLLRKLKIGQVVREEMQQMHATKVGTPTMGGVLIIASIVLSTLLWVDVTNIQVWLVLGVMVYMGGIGFLDDYAQIRKQRSKGLSARGKILLQILGGAIVVVVLRALPEDAGRLQHVMVPFVKDPVFADIGLLFAFAWVILVVVGASNAVNLTDGLDGLAIGCSSSVALSYLVLSYAAGHAAFAEYLLVPYVRGRKQYDQVTPSFTHTLWWNNFDPDFMESPHRKRLIREAGLPEYWRENGFPPRCRAVGADDFDCD